MPATSSETLSPAEAPAIHNRRGFVRIARAMLAAYLCALVTATHWPHLDLRPAQEVLLAADKVLHLSAYAVLAGLAIAARVARVSTWSGLTASAAGVATIAAVDELTQAAVPGRTFSMLDMAASATGGVAVLVGFAVVRRCVRK